MHGTEHACNEPVDAPTLLHEGYKRRYPTFVVRGVTEVSENHLLKRVDLVLKTHEV